VAPLDRYHKKRNFGQTPEPEGATPPGHRERLSFCIQKHAARRLHYDFRLELDGVLKSWAVPNGPSLDPAEKRLAVHVEDHPLEYGSFEGVIPPGQYGAGTVVLWDRGRWIPREDPHEGYRQGKLKFDLVGEKLRGAWTLVRMGGRAGEDGKNWLLIKERDATARPLADGDVLDERPESVAGAPAIDDAPVATLPAQLAPQLATLTTDAPAGPEWLHELKYDGYRALCRVEGGAARIFSRSGKEWTREMASVARAASALPLDDAWLDGEVVVFGPDGRTSFQALQNALAEKRDDALAYVVFDLPFLDGRDLRALPLVARKQELAALVARAAPAGDVIRFGDHVEGDGPAFFRQAAGLGVEGIVSKRRDAPYESTRTTTWRKVRCQKRQEFVVAGFTAPAGSRVGLGALLIGVYDRGALVYVGRVGTGFDDATLRTLRTRLDAMRIETSPFAPGEIAPPKGSTFVRPELVAEVVFTEWTSDGQLRHPTFQGFREDVRAIDVVRERPAETPTVTARRTKARKAAGQPPVSPPSGTVAKTRKDAAATVAGVRLTHPERLLWPEVGVTKQELAQFYESIAAWMVPHLDGRPLSLVRGPQGHTGEQFFHKHVGKGWPDAIRLTNVREGGKEITYAMVADAAGLVGLAQMDVLEIHPWGSRHDQIEKPDRIIFDLDPDPALPWRRIVEAAAHVRVFLHDLGLTSFVKTTGGKGLHVVVPIARKLEWDEVKSFSGAVASTLAKRDRALFTASMAKSARTGKVYVDFLRNGRGQTAVAAYSTRARAGAPVSTPLRWDELLSESSGDRWNVRNLPKRLGSMKADPWEGFFEERQGVTKAMIAAVR
jgi:bifunctional non-homologous end joining protein LigD